jgi:predicted pyridoxine 5'-phosphate oxidase superfamily flavin-nucleotide-binding protein
MVTLYHDGMRELQDMRETRALADRLASVTLRHAFTPEDQAFIQRCPMFFLATADAEGRPDCSYKGGLPGFVRVVDERTLAFPDYDGNGMYRSLGNLKVNPHVGLLFIDFVQPKRLRVNGVASIAANDVLLDAFPGAVFIVRVAATHIFPNCPRYVHRMAVAEPSVYAPREHYEPPVPAWKTFDAFRDALPTRDRAAAEAAASQPASPTNRNTEEPSK